MEVVGKCAFFNGKLAISRKRWEIVPMLLLTTNRKSHTPFQVKWKSSTLDDLGGQYCNRNSIYTVARLSLRQLGFFVIIWVVKHSSSWHFYATTACYASYQLPIPAWGISKAGGYIIRAENKIGIELCIQRPVIVDGRLFGGRYIVGSIDAFVGKLLAGRRWFKSADRSAVKSMHYKCRHRQSV